MAVQKVSTPRPWFPPQELLDILAKDVRFKVDTRAVPACGQVRNLTRMRYDPDAEPVMTNARDGQADAIDCNRPLFDDVAHDRRWRIDIEHVVLAVALKAPNFPAGINMAKHEVPVEPRIGAEGTFEIDERAALHEFKIRPPKGFVEYVELQRATLRGDHGQTGPIDRDTVARAERRPDLKGANGQFRRTLARADLLNLSRFFTNSREHASADRDAFVACPAKSSHVGHTDKAGFICHRIGCATRHPEPCSVER